MNHIILSALLPVMALILLGLAVGRARWLGPTAVRHLSTVALMVLTPVNSGGQLGVSPILSN